MSNLPPLSRWAEEGFSFKDIRRHTDAMLENPQGETIDIRSAIENGNTPSQLADLGWKLCLLPNARPYGPTFGDMVTTQKITGEEFLQIKAERSKRRRLLSGQPMVTGATAGGKWVAVTFNKKVVMTTYARVEKSKKPPTHRRYPWQN